MKYATQKSPEWRERLRENAKKSWAVRDGGPEQRFWNNFIGLSENECWLWKKGINRNGYGNTKWKNKFITTSRLAYMLKNGPIPKGMCVCHSCDNRACCNPSHLWLGTNTDNMRDMMAKNRHGRRPLWKITEAQVVEILEMKKRGVFRRSGGITQRAHAQKLGVSESLIGKIISGTACIHVKRPDL